MNNSKNKYFYSHIVNTASITIELADMELTADERIHLILLAESNVHHTVLDIVLSELPQEDKKEFLNHARDDNHEKIWELLKSKVENIEDKIKTAAQDIIKELHKDIEESKKKK